METTTALEMKQPTKKKHRFLRIILRILIILLLLALIIGTAVFIYSRYTQTHYKISFYQETSRKVSDNIRLVVISDLHNREYGENNGTLISDIRSLHPDLILLPGDMVIREEDDYQPMLDLVSE